MFVTGIVWLIVGLGRQPEYLPWAGFGAMAAIGGAVVYLALWAGLGRLPPRMKNWRQASLVISPVGLAMVQGDIQGELRWDEIQDVRIHTGARPFRLSAETGLPGIVLSVPGAKILIADLYDRPLLVIYERIRQYWRRDGAAT